jgi:hypothetical protein
MHLLQTASVPYQQATSKTGCQGNIDPSYDPVPWFLCFPSALARDNKELPLSLAPRNRKLDIQGMKVNQSSLKKWLCSQSGQDGRIQNVSLSEKHWLELGQI